MYTLNYTDPLLTDWAMHHLHISNTKKKPTNPFYDPSDWLLFAHVKPNDIYLVDIHPHTKTGIDVFARKDLLKVLYRNWPEIMEPFELKGTPVGSKDLTNKEISTIREKTSHAKINFN